MLKDHLQAKKVKNKKSMSIYKEKLEGKKHLTNKGKQKVKAMDKSNCNFNKQLRDTQKEEKSDIKNINH